MDIHYNAFISYRHHPEDIKVAEQIHKGLEHYRIPKALKKKKDTKMRLFRDKEELPITSNLTDDITRALRNSDFLIVICSTHTKESVWVQREIETFLQTHDHSRVLTVLVNGEPYDTIPEILCSEERIDPATGEKYTLPIEPLSCDWRGGKRKAYREELPRLAAALLGCGYDELRQRERQYRTRRLVTVFSIALAAVIGFAGYVIYNSMQIQKANERLEEANNQLETANNQLVDANIEIQKNLEEAQINQSQYLASASEQQLEAGDRLLAINLALAGLPDDTQDRPYVAETEMALSRAVGAYVANEEMVAVGAITCDALVSYFEATDERDYMYVFDYRHMLTVWDLETLQKISTAQLPSTLSKMLITAQQNVVLFGSNSELYCYDKDCNLLWKIEGQKDVVFSKDRELLLTRDVDNNLHFWDPVTGKATRDPMLVAPELGSEYKGSLRFKQKEYDLSRPIVLEINTFDEAFAVVVDTQQGTVRVLDTYLSDDYEIRYTGTTAEGGLLVLITDTDALWNGQFSEMYTHSMVDVRLLCYKPDREELVWEAKLTTYNYVDIYTLDPIPNTDNVLCQIDNLFAMVNGKTGEVLGTCEMGENPIWVRTYDTYALAVTKDGSVGTYNYESNDYGSVHWLKDNLAAGFGGKGVYVNQADSTQILIYNYKRDENWQRIEGDYDALVNTKAVAGNMLAVENYDGIYMFDVQARKLLWEAPEPEGKTFQIIGFSQDASKLWVCASGEQMVEFDTLTGEYETHSLPEKASEEVTLYYKYSDTGYIKDDVIYAKTKDLWTDEQYLLAFDTKTLETTFAKVCPKGTSTTAYLANPVILDVREGKVLYWENTTETLYRVNMQSGDVEPLRENVSIQPDAQFLDDSGSYVIGVDNEVILYDYKDIPVLTVTLEDVAAVSCYLEKDQLLILTDAGTVHRYSLAGEKLGEIGMNLYSGFFSHISYDFDPNEIVWTKIGDEDLFVSAFEAGNLIDLNSWQIRAFVPHTVCYAEEADRFVTTFEESTWEYTLGVYERYSLEKLQQMGKDALKGTTLTEDQKAEYGIS